MNVIDVTNVSKVFRDFWRRPKVAAVDDLTLEVRAGEIFGLLGPNGSGKSTTLKMILGLLHPSAGHISILGKGPHNVAVKGELGYLPEESYLYRYLTARETLAFYGSLFNIEARERRRRTDELLEMVDLTQAADRPVGEFSKGMMRRVGLAQALVNDPRLIILDEPTAGLDPIGCRQVKDLILALARRGKTILLSSHLLADVEDVCDRIAILFSGRLRAQGGVEELLENKERVRLTLPALPKPQIENVLATLRQHTGTDPELDHPALNLEQFFLEVVADAHRAAASGRPAAHMVAPFLDAGRPATTPD